MQNKRVAALRIVFLIAVIFILVVVSVVVLLIMGIVHYDKYLAKNLDNKYINNNYDKWKSVTFFEKTTVYTPETWSIIQDKSIYRITDQEKSTVAFCTFIQKDASEFCDASDFLSELVDFDVTDIETGYPSDVLSLGNASCTQAKVCGATQYEEFYYLTLGDIEYYLLFVFPSDKGTDRESLMEILEAIIYSYQFGDF